MPPEKAAYGTWNSPVTTQLLTQKSTVLDQVLVDEITHEIYHVERRPSEIGRSTLVETQEQKDVVDQHWNVRTGVFEYGGSAATVHNGVAYFSNYQDGRIYRTENGKAPEPVTPENTNWRYTELSVVRTRPNIMIAALEDHTKPGPATVVNTLVAIDTISQVVETIAEGADFYLCPSISKDCNRLAWIQWNHPDMPWEGSELMVAEIDQSSASFKVKNPRLVAGRPDEISVMQPQWASDDTLVFLNDISGFLNPWYYSAISSKAGPIAVNPVTQDFADVGPGRTLGRRDYAILDMHTVLFASLQDGCSVLSLADLRSHSLKPVPSPYVFITQLRAISSHEAVFIGKKHDEASAVIRITLNVDGEVTYTVIYGKANPSLPRYLISKAQAYSLPAPPLNDPIHVLYYAPFSPDFVPLDGEIPPAVISVHGGPTGRAAPGLDWAIQFWTSRGWAWVEVNYGGSSGYGRKYRERLKGNWGVLDVTDTVEAVTQLSERGLIDIKRTAIRGGSAGGFTVLAALTSKPKVFAAGTSLFGVSDLASLGADGHKFESRYLEKLIGGRLEEIPDLYETRSPLSHAGKIEAPLLVLQGSEDTIVPPSQAEVIVESVKHKGGRVQYILFQGESHGWRKAETIKKALEVEFAWYLNVFGLDKL